jgi:hypothetical protein
VELLLGVVEMRKFLDSYRLDNVPKFGVSFLEEMELVIEMAMDCCFDRGSAGPNPVAAEARRQETQKPPAPAPELHDAAWPRLSLRHRRPKQGTMRLLVPKHFRQGGHAVRTHASGDQKLSGVNSDRTKFAGVIHPHNARNRQGIAGCVSHHFISVNLAA